jgi:hypothetical protein
MSLSSELDEFGREIDLHLSCAATGATEARRHAITRARADLAGLRPAVLALFERIEDLLAPEPKAVVERSPRSRKQPRFVQAGGDGRVYKKPGNR